MLIIRTSAVENVDEACINSIITGECTLGLYSPIFLRHAVQCHQLQNINNLLNTETLRRER